MRPVLTVFCLTVLSSVAMLAQAPFRSGFLHAVIVTGDVDPVYVNRPREPARHVYFPGERIEFLLELFNGNQQAYVYPVPEGGVVNLFPATAVTAPAFGRASRLHSIGRDLAGWCSLRRCPSPVSSFRRGTWRSFVPPWRMSPNRGCAKSGSFRSSARPASTPA